ncbi:MAG TPA: hypothetical protein VNJ53_07865 [Gaiellaceae bacterium]|nr:hypothetical protein [Gaiellaceae bacterium]
MPRYRLWIVFRGGWQWPFQEGDVIQVRSQTLEILAEIPASLIEAVIAHHLDGLALQAALGRYRQTRLDRNGPPPLLVRRRLTSVRRAVHDPGVRAELRAARRGRR